MAASLPDELLARILSPVDSIKSLVQARNLAPHLVEGPPIYVCGRGSRPLAAYLLAQLYDLPLALACVDLERLMGVYLRGSEWRALLRGFACDVDDASSSVSFSSSCAEDDDDDGVVLAAFEAGVVSQRSAWYAENVR